MKTQVCTFLMLLAGITATFAQTEKGRWTVGASVGNLTYSTQNSYHSFSGSLAPSAGRFVANNFEIGTGVPLSLSTNKYNTPTGDYKASNLSIGLSPYMRYYFGSEKLKPFVGLSYGYQRTIVRTQEAYQSLKGSGFTSTVTPTIGLAYFINRSVALNASLNYVWQTYRSAYAYNNTNSVGNPIDVPVSTAKYMSLGIGFQIFLGN